jgi:hypothetical protein
MPIIVAILGILASYGFTIGIAIQPFSIYKRLVKIGWWNNKL